MLTAELRQLAQTLGIKRIEGKERGGFVEFSEKNKVDPVYLIGLLQRQPKIYRLEGPTKLKFMQDLTDRTQRLKFISELLAAFAQHRVA